MSALIKLLGVITPPPAAPAPREYSGLEYRWKFLTFRPAEFKFEGLMFAVIGAYLLTYFVGKYFSDKRAKSVANGIVPTLKAQFASVRPPVMSSPAQHLIYASGRRNVVALHTTIKLYPLHDLVGLITNTGKSIIEPTFDASEQIHFDFTLGKGDQGLQGEGLGVWGVVDKGAMRETKENRFDLTFARLHEVASVPITHALFAEHSDITDVILKTPGVGMFDLVNNPKAAAVLKSFIITDVPTQRPTQANLAAKSRLRQINLTVYKPKTSEQVEAVKAWLQVAFNIADLSSRPGVVRPDLARRLANTRKTVQEDLVKEIKKREEEDNPPAETAEDKRAAKKKAERAAMSEKDRLKAEALDQKRDMRKMQKKQMGKQQ